jgi:kumamolisin
MRHSIALVTIAAAVLFLMFALSMPVALAQNGDQVIVPASSIEYPWDIGVRAHTNILILFDRSALADAPPTAETPASLACIYHLAKQTKGCPQSSTVLPTGGAKAIALVDAYDNPDAETDIKTFAATYGYGTPNFTKVKVGNPPPDAGWAVEESLDIEYAFGMAPHAHIYLVEANSNSYSDLLAAEDKATELLQAEGGGEASNSWQGGESSGETSYDSHFKGKDVVYFAAAGDSGGHVGYPSVSPFVVSAGGTTINRNGSGDFTSESAWSDAGGGPSQFEKRPSYQNIIKKIVGTHRGTPDFSSNANPNSGVAVQAQYGCENGYGQYCNSTYWLIVGGTSVSSPTLAGIVNAAGTFNTSTSAENTEAYKDYGNAKNYRADWRDITTGSNGYACKKGWEFCTGIGSPITYKGK